MILRREHADVTAVHGATDAIKRMSSHHYDAILTDLHMPAGDGYSLIGSTCPNMRQRIVIMTGSLDNAVDGANAFGVGFVLPKPCSPIAIVQASSQCALAPAQISRYLRFSQALASAFDL